MDGMNLRAGPVVGRAGGVSPQAGGAGPWAGGGLPRAGGVGLRADGVSPWVAACAYGLVRRARGLAGRARVILNGWRSGGHQCAITVTAYHMAGGIIRLDEGWRLDAGHRMDQAPLVTPVVAVAALKKKKGSKTMDFMPNKRAERYFWWKNLSDKITVEGPKFDLAAGEITVAKGIADDQIAKMEATDSAQATLDGKRAEERASDAANQAAIRLKIRNWKTLPGYPASGSEGVLRLKGTESVFDPGAFKPVIKVSIEGGVIKVDFIKSGCDSMVVYCRLRGTTTWTKLGTDSESPYFDTKPLANPNVPEVREYMAMGMINDEEIGLPSDIVSVTLA